MPEFWHRISHRDYSEIHWSYEKAPRLTCNGIKVSEPSPSGVEYYYDARDRIENLWEGHLLTLRCPSVSVFDPDGCLPLLLQRTGLATPSYPFHEDLLNDVVKDLLAFILVNAPQGPITQATFAESYSKFYFGFDTGRCKWLFLCSLSEGSSIVDSWHLQAEEVIRCRRALLMPSVPGVPSAVSNASGALPDLIVPFKVPDGPQELRAWLRSVMGGSDTYHFGPAMGLKRRGCRMLIREKTLREFKQPGLIAQYYWSVIEEESHTNGWVVLRTGDCRGPSVDFQKLAESTTTDMEGLAEWYLAQDQPKTGGLSPIAKAWKEIVGVPIIPFDVEERRTKLQGAFDFLKSYIAAHEKSKEKAKKT